MPKLRTAVALAASQTVALTPGLNPGKENRKPNATVA
jgi:hypothetical protein